MASAVSKNHPVIRLNKLATKFGCPKLIALERPTTKPAQIQYLDLLPSGKKDINEPIVPHAVAEFQGKPVMYLLDETVEAVSDEKRLELQQRLANRSDHAVLAVVRPGDLTLYPINLSRKELLRGKWETISLSDPAAPFLFQEIACGTRTVKGNTDTPDPVFAEIHRLLEQASNILAKPQGPLDGLTVLSLTGRALFFRFLMDRKIVREEDLSKICPSAKNGDLKDVFSNVDKAAHVSAWLDEAFNGDLLPLVDAITKQTPPDLRRHLYRKAYQDAGNDTHGAIFMHLEAILRGWDQIAKGAVQLTFEVDWDDLNFRHIPVGVLSQVYETFSHQWDSHVAKDTSVHYTPKNIAKLIVDQALAGLPNVHDARVLDPACGAGVFLVLAFRELVRRRWEKDKKRPGTKVIHRVLYKQLCGFDISESALRLSALALYITAIELNEIIRPPEALQAPEALKNLVLFNFAPDDSAERSRGFVLGSLGSDVPESFNGVFDVVVGNPPWTRLRAKGETEAEKEKDQIRISNLNREFTAIGQRILKSRNLEVVASKYWNPDNVPDLAFIWKATEWAKDGGVIGFALDARLILKQSDVGKIARDALFQGISVTGILSGASLEKSKVWPKMDMPWLLLWAKNSVAPENHSFHLLTPVRENSLADKGEFRLDYQSAYLVSVKDILRRGWLLKALGSGTVLDVDILTKFWTVDLSPSVKFGGVRNFQPARVII